MDSFSTAPGASRQLQTKAVCDATENVEVVVSFASAEGDVWGDGRCRGLAVWDQMTRHLETIAALRIVTAVFRKERRKGRREYCTTPRWWRWFDGSQPPRWR